MSNSRSTNTGALQGCVLSPLVFSLYTNDCTYKDPSVKLLKFSDNTTLISLIQDGDESAYRQEVKELAAWCSLNQRSPTTEKVLGKMCIDMMLCYLLCINDCSNYCVFSLYAIDMW